VSGESPAKLDDSEREFRSLGLSDARVGIYLFFATEISFFAAVLGAYIVLRHSVARTSFANEARVQLLWIIEVSSLTHVLGGMLAYQVPKLMGQKQRQLSSEPLFWKLTGVMLAMVFAVLVFTI
jgi:heme/copper-type cytochrome/quinol oxidase subunit 3